LTSYFTEKTDTEHVSAQQGINKPEETFTSTTQKASLLCLLKLKEWLYILDSQVTKVTVEIVVVCERIAVSAVWGVQPVWPETQLYCIYFCSSFYFFKDEEKVRQGRHPGQRRGSRKTHVYFVI
jgi:hypothetical protein